MTVKLVIGGMTDGHAVGLCHFSSTWSLFGIVQNGRRRTLVHSLNGTTMPLADVHGDTIFLRSHWAFDGISRYSHSLDGTNWASTQAVYQMAWGHYRGDRCGVYSFNEKAESGFVDVVAIWYDYAHDRATVDSTSDPT